MATSIPLLMPLRSVLTHLFLSLYRHVPEGFSIMMSTMDLYQKRLGGDESMHVVFIAVVRSLAPLLLAQ